MQRRARLLMRRFSVRTRARAIGFAVVFVGVLDILSALTPPIDRRLEWIDTYGAPALANAAAGATAFSGVLLLLIGRGLVRRRRVALWLALAVLLVTAVTHIAKGLDFEEAAAGVAVAALLISQRDIFNVSFAPARWRTAVVNVPIVIAVAFSYGIIGLVLRHDDVVQRLTVASVLHEVTARFVGMSGDLTIHGRFGRWFPASVTAVGMLAMAWIVASVLAPAAARAIADPAARERVRQLLDRRDGDTLDGFALRHDKHYVFSSDGHAAVAYRCVTGVGLMSGDPVGDPASFSDAVHAFVDMCDTFGWRPAVLGARRDRLPIYESAGLKALYLGDEAVVDVPGFTLDCPPMRAVRQAVNRTRRAGVTCEIHREGELDPTLRRALIGIADRHRADQPERGFSMALDGLLEGRHPEAVVAVARDADGTPFAFQRYIPCRSGASLSLDAMRRDKVGVNGVNERLIFETVTWAAAHQVEEVSLNFAVAREILTEGAELSPAAAAEAWVLRRLNGFFQIESLLTFNAKFQPRWVARYLAYRSVGDLVPVAVAALSAEAFLPLDRARGDAADAADAPEPTPAPAEPAAR